MSTPNNHMPTPNNNLHDEHKLIQLLTQIGKSLNRSDQDIQRIIHKLVSEEWFSSIQSLQALKTDAEWERLKLPRRFMLALRETLNTTESPADIDNALRNRNDLQEDNKPIKFNPYQTAQSTTRADYSTAKLNSANHADYDYKLITNEIQRENNKRTASNPKFSSQVLLSKRIYSSTEKSGNLRTEAVIASSSSSDDDEDNETLSDLRDIIRRNGQRNTFRSARKGELERVRKAPVYESVSLKVISPDRGFILHVELKPSLLIGDLYRSLYEEAFSPELKAVLGEYKSDISGVSNSGRCETGEFWLFQAPPYRRMDLKHNLYESKLIPSAVVRLGWSCSTLENSNGQPVFNGPYFA